MPERHAVLIDTDIRYTGKLLDSSNTFSIMLAYVLHIIINNCILLLPVICFPWGSHHSASPPCLTLPSPLGSWGLSSFCRPIHTCSGCCTVSGPGYTYSGWIYSPAHSHTPYWHCSHSLGEHQQSEQVEFYTIFLLSLQIIMSTIIYLFFYFATKSWGTVNLRMLISGLNFLQHSNFN